MFNVIAYNTQSIEVARKWYTGLTAIRQGEVICFDNASDCLLPNNSTYYDPTMPIIGPAAAQISRFHALGNSVTYPSDSGTGTGFGIAADSSIGKVGPCWIDVMVPKRGDIMLVELIGDGSSHPAVGDSMEIDYTNDCMKYDAAVAAGLAFSAVFVGKADRSSTYSTATRALGWVQFTY